MRTYADRENYTCHDFDEVANGGGGVVDAFDVLGMPEFVTAQQARCPIAGICESLPNA